MSLQDRTRAEIVTAYRTLEAENAVKSLEIVNLRRKLAEAQQEIESRDNYDSEIMAMIRKATSPKTDFHNTAEGVEYLISQIAEAKQAFRVLHENACVVTEERDHFVQLAHQRYDQLVEAHQARERAEADAKSDEAALISVFAALEEAGVPDTGERTGPRAVKWLGAEDRVKWLSGQLAAANALLERAEPYCKTTSGHPYDEGLCAAITAHLKPGAKVEDAEEKA